MLGGRVSLAMQSLLYVRATRTSVYVSYASSIEQHSSRAAFVGIVLFHRHVTYLVKQNTAQCNIATTSFFLFFSIIHFRKITIFLKPHFRAQELCESRGGRPGLHVPNLTFSVDVKEHWTL